MKWDSIAWEKKQTKYQQTAVLIELFKLMTCFKSVTYLVTIFVFEQTYTVELQNQYGLISINNNNIYIKLHVPCKQSALFHSSLQRIIHLYIYLCT